MIKLFVPGNKSSLWSLKQELLNLKTEIKKKKKKRKTGNKAPNLYVVKKNTFVYHPSK